MPTLAVAEASNAAFCPSYIPVAVVVGGTSGVGQAMAEALARQLNGRAHIIIIGRNPTTAAKILATFPKPNEPDGWTHEFVPCDGLSMASVHAVCAGLIARLTRINFLIITAGGPAGNSMLDSYATPEGLDAHLAMRCVSIRFPATMGGRS
jgi:NAD(P)-dependent dehydrogenase (short-subunit alcohol dehydrogenase family)